MFPYGAFQKMQVDQEESKQEESQPTQAETKSNPEEMEVLQMILFWLNFHCVSMIAILLI